VQKRAPSPGQMPSRSPQRPQDGRKATQRIGAMAKDIETREGGDMAEGLVTEDRVLGHFQKSNSASIQVSLVNWQGADYVDVREVVPSSKAGEQFAFTKKGIRFHVDLVGKLLDLLRQVDPE
jgi:hypothetical protein